MTKHPPGRSDLGRATRRLQGLLYVTIRYVSWCRVSDVYFVRIGVLAKQKISPLSLRWRPFLLSTVQFHSYFIPISFHPRASSSNFNHSTMGLVKKFHTIVGDKPASAAADSVEDPRPLQGRADLADVKEANLTPVNEVSIRDQEKPSDDAQAGVKKIEAITIAWSKGSAYLVLVL